MGYLIIAPELVPVAVMMFDGADFDETNPGYRNLAGLDVVPAASYVVTHYRCGGLDLSRVRESVGNDEREYWHAAGLPVERRQEIEANNLARGMQLIAAAKAKRASDRMEGVR